MTNEPQEDFKHLPPSVPLEDTVAFQVMDDDEPYGGPGGGGGNAIDGDGD